MRGFTLIELLAVLIILGLILLISVPIITNILDSAENNLHDEQISIIEDAAKKWAVANSYLLPQENNQSYYVSLNNLYEQDFIENNEIIDPKTKEVMNGCVKITYNESYNQYEYKYGNECSNS